LELLNKIREHFALSALKRLPKAPDKPIMFKYGNAKSIGIVYNADNNAQTRAALELYNTLRSEGKQAATLGFFNIDRKKATVHPKLGFDYFYKSDLDWKFMPKNGIVDTFINTNFDLLIDITTDKLLPVEMVIAQSKARLKAGPLRNGNTAFYDFMIGGAGIQNIDTFAAQLIHYLKLLNN
jgi:hypothetical protein